MRAHVPFDALWGMPIDVPYSLLLRDGDLAWTCGQLPLDEASTVLHPGDLVSQTRVVRSYIDEILKRGGLTGDDVGKLVIYYVDGAPGTRETMIDVFREAYGEAVLLVPVAVPYFYYEDLLIEVDVFTSTTRGTAFSATSADGRMGLDLIDAGELVWATLSVAGDGSSPLVSRPDPFIDDTLARFAIGGSDLLAEHWYVCGRDGQGFSRGHVAGFLRAQGFLADVAPMVLTGSADTRVIGELTFVRGPGSVATDRQDRPGGTRITTRAKARFAWVSGYCPQESAGLVGQTELIMDGVAEALSGIGMAFSDVAKSTTHYTGSSSADDLHDNMAVRNRRYTRPGPASTGLPVLELGDARCRTAIDVVAAATHKA